MQFYSQFYSPANRYSMSLVDLSRNILKSLDIGLLTITYHRVIAEQKNNPDFWDECNGGQDYFQVVNLKYFQKSELKQGVIKILADTKISEKSISVIPTTENYFSNKQLEKLLDSPSQFLEINIICQYPTHDTTIKIINQEKLTKNQKDIIVKVIKKIYVTSLALTINAVIDEIKETNYSRTDTLQLYGVLHKYFLEINIMGIIMDYLFKDVIAYD